MTFGMIMNEIGSDLDMVSMDNNRHKSKMDFVCPCKYLGHEYEQYRCRFRYGVHISIFISI